MERLSISKWQYINMLISKSFLEEEEKEEKNKYHSQHVLRCVDTDCLTQVVILLVLKMCTSVAFVTLCVLLLVTL